MTQYIIRRLILMIPTLIGDRYRRNWDWVRNPDYYDAADFLTTKKLKHRC
ncbi:MAG: hypothetical protein R3B97_09245 [Dehalococcoidia bacterium]